MGATTRFKLEIRSHAALFQKLCKDVKESFPLIDWLLDRIPNLGVPARRLYRVHAYRVLRIIVDREARPAFIMSFSLG